MLNLSTITNLRFLNSTKESDLISRLQDVIRSLSSTIVDRSDAYIQNYISLQTFANDGSESTSSIRKANAYAPILQAYKDLKISETVESLSNSQHNVSLSLGAITVDGTRYVFGFRGDELIFEPSLDLGNDFLYSGSYYWRNTNAIGLDQNFNVRTRLNVIGNRWCQTSLDNQGNVYNNETIVWFWFEDVYTSSPHYWMENRVIIYKRSTHECALYEVDKAYVESNDTGLAMVAAMRNCVDKCNLESIYKFSIGSALPGMTLLYTCTVTEYNSHIDAQYNNSHFIIPWPTRKDYILNSETGKCVLEVKDLPSAICNWMIESD